MARRQIFRRLELAARHKLPAIYHYSKRRPIDGGELAAARPRGGGVDREREQRRHHLARDHRMTTDRLFVTLDHYDRRPSLFRQYKHISTQDYRDGRKDNSRCKLRDLFYFWCGLLLAWRRCQRRL